MERLSNAEPPPQSFGQLPQQVGGAERFTLRPALLGEVAEGRRGCLSWHAISVAAPTLQVLCRCLKNTPVITTSTAASPNQVMA